MDVSGKPRRHAGLSRELPSVLVSILSYNSAEDTINTIRSFEQQTYPNFVLQVVDNASSATCVQEVSQAFSGLTITVLPANLGYTGGGNFILKQALDGGFDYAIICTHDVEIDEHGIESLVQTAREHRDAGIVGGVELNLVTGEQRARGGGRYNPWFSRLRWVGDTAIDQEAWKRVQAVHGALVLFSRRALEAGILFDNNLFMYLDEIDIGAQLERKGLLALVDRRVVFRHKSAPYQFDEYVGYLSQRNRLYMAGKYGRWYHFAFYLLYASLLELPVKVVIRTLQGHARFGLACIVGHCDALRKRMGPKRVHAFLNRLAK